MSTKEIEPFSHTNEEDKTGSLHYAGISGKFSVPPGSRLGDLSLDQLSEAREQMADLPA